MADEEKMRTIKRTIGESILQPKFHLWFTAAAERENLGLMRLFLKAGIDPNSRNIISETSLHIAARLDHWEVIEFLLSDKRTDIEARDRNEMTPLHWAAREGHWETVELLLNEGAKINVQDRDMESPLHKAAFRGHLETVRVLLKGGADRTIRNSSGYLAMDRAIERRFQNIVALLK